MINIPNRRKSDDNPYTLEVINNNYFVVFKDKKYRKQVVEVNEEIFNEMSQFELDDISQMHKKERHDEYSELCDETLYRRAINKPASVIETVENKLINDELKKAISSLSEVQKRRIKMYYFDGLTQQEIANIEKTSIRAIQYTLNDSLKKLKEILKKFKK